MGDGFNLSICGSTSDKETTAFFDIWTAQIMLGKVNMNIRN
jgi:hypothetical protein